MQDRTFHSNTGGIRKLLFLVAGIVALVIGLIGSSFGRAWSPQVYEFLFGFKIVIFIDSFMPYFPLVPFYPMFIMVLGAYLIAKSRG
jgi:membrane-bound ClpP family serine protease